MNRNKFTRYFLPVVFKASLSKRFPSFYNLLKVKPAFAALSITDNCCFKCRMCGQGQGSDSPEMKTSGWKGILRQLKENGQREVSFSGGGEPFLRKDSMELIEYAKDLGFNIGVITNGYLMDRSVFDRLAKIGIDNISISIGGEENEFDSSRGVKGAYQKVMHSCEILSEFTKNNLISGNLYFTLMKNSLSDYRQALEISANLRLPLVVNLFDYTPYFFKSKEPERHLFWIDNDEDADLLKKLQKDFIDKKRNDPESIYHTYTEIEYFGRYFKDPLQKNIPCIVSQQRIGIDSGGNVYGGCWSMGSFGNLKENSLKNIIHSEKYQTLHKKMFFKNCCACSCGYSMNLRYYLPSLIREALFRALPASRRLIWR